MIHLGIGSDSVGEVISFVKNAVAVTTSTTTFANILTTTGYLFYTTNGTKSVVYSHGPQAPIIPASASFSITCCSSTGTPKGNFTSIQTGYTSSFTSADFSKCGNYLQDIVCYDDNYWSMVTIKLPVSSSSIRTLDLYLPNLASVLVGAANTASGTMDMSIYPALTKFWFFGANAAFLGLKASPAAVDFQTDAIGITNIIFTTSNTTLQTLNLADCASLATLTLPTNMSALTTLRLSNNPGGSAYWTSSSGYIKIPNSVSSLYLGLMKFVTPLETSRFDLDLTDCTSITNLAAHFDTNILSVGQLKRSPAFTLSSLGKLTLNNTGITSLSIDGGVLNVFDEIEIIGNTSLTSVSITNPGYLKTITIKDNPSLTSVSITGTSNRILVDIVVTISGNSLLTTRTFSPGTWINQTPVPTITSVSPNYGPLTAGTAITIGGTNLTGAYSVTVGGVAATSVNAASATSITAVTPAGTASQKSVLVKTVATSAVTTAPATNFTYITAPVITTISPASGSTNIGGGNTKVTFTGSSFLGTTSIKLNNLATHAFAGIVITSDTSMYAFSPARGTLTALLSYPVYITNSIGTTQKTGFAYYN